MLLGAMKIDQITIGQINFWTNLQFLKIGQDGKRYRVRYKW